MELPVVLSESPYPEKKFSELTFLGIDKLILDH